MGPEKFELFAQALHGAQDGVFSTNTYGTTGYKQYGADHVAFRQGGSSPEVEVGQSKAYREFEKDGIGKAVEAFLLHWEDHWKAKNVRRFILFVGCNIKTVKAADEIIERTAALAALGVSFEVWDARGIYLKLAAAPNVVRTFLGLDWLQQLFGSAANPLAEISADLVRGDLGALKAAAFVGQLNKAETARVVELRRRIRRGEMEAVRREVADALTPFAVAALGPEVHADLLRLSAAMHIAGAAAEQAKAELDQADALDGKASTRLRAMLCTQQIGPESTIAGGFDANDPEVAEVLAVANLRLGNNHEALVLLEPALNAKPSAETLRIAALGHLLVGDRERAVDLARRSAQRDSDSRACLQALALCLFARALSPSFELVPGDWPAPIDPAMVLRTDAARADLQEADLLLQGLAEDSSLAEHREMLAWSFAVRACSPWRRPSAGEMLAEIVAAGHLSAPIVVWAFSRGMALDRPEGRRVIAAERAIAPDDLQLLLIEVAIASEERDRSHARELLGQGRQAMIDRGLEGYHRYWLGLLDIDDGRVVPDAVLEEWPWLALRAAMRIRYKRRRLEKVAAIARRAADGDADPRILVVAVQILYDAGRCGTAAPLTDALVARVATAEAVNLAVYVLHRADLHQKVLDVLADPTPFPGATLPEDLKRISIASKAGLGRLVEAAQELSDLAAVTGAPMDIWTSIGWQLSVGALSDARDLYLRHQDRLGELGPGHLQLANAVIRTDPALATNIARRLVADAPDDLVTATFELANRLRLDDAQGRLIRRIQTLGARGEAGVQVLNGVDEVLVRMGEHRKRVDEAWEVYQNGHSPVHMLAHFGPAAFAEQYLGNLLDPPAAPRRPSPLQARYGRRYDTGIWPARRRDVSLVVDLSALLTIHGLGLLDVVERAFRPLRVAPDVINAIALLLQRLSAVQPARLDATRQLVALRRSGHLPDPATLSQIDTFRVTWEADGAEPDSTLNLSRLVEALADELQGESMAVVRERLAETVRPGPTGPTPPAGATVILDTGIAIELHLAGALDAARRRFVVAVPHEELDARAADVAQAEAHERLATSLEKLAGRIAEGAKDGTYEFVPFDSKAGNELITRQYMECLRSMGSKGSILWIDDRFTTSMDRPEVPIVTTVEVLDALARFARIDQSTLRTSRLRLRAAGWMFMPVTGEEIAEVIRPCVLRGSVIEDDSLGVLRRSTAWTVIERRRMQWPTPEQGDAGVTGELPFLIDQGSAVPDALVRIWSDDALDSADAAAASTWVLEKLDMCSTAPAVIAAGDSRSDVMIGLHIGHLLTAALQIVPVAGKAQRRSAYLSWLWQEVVGPRMRIYPEAMPHAIETLARNIAVDPLDDPKLQRYWIGFCAEVVNALPLPLREPLLARPEMRDMFELTDEGVMTIPLGQFPTRAYLSVLVEIADGESRVLRSGAGRKVSFRGERRPDGTVGVTASMGRKRHSFDDWAKRISSDAPDVRLKALKEQSAGLDLSPESLGDLNAQMQDLKPVDRAVKAVDAASDGMTGWYGSLTAQLRERRTIGVLGLVPPKLEPLLRRLQLTGAPTIAEAQRRTIAAVGLKEAIHRWSAVPVVPATAFQEVASALEDDDVIAMASDIASGAPAWVMLFLAKVLWSRTTDCPRLLDVLAQGSLGATSSDRAKEEWACLVVCAQFVAAELPQMDGWSSLTKSQGLAVVWSHAGTLTHSMLAARLNVKALIQFFTDMRLASPRNLLGDPSGFAGDVANPLDALSERVIAHAAAPILAELAATEGHAVAAGAAGMGLLMNMQDGTPVATTRIMHGELLTGDELNSHLAVSVCPSLEPLVGGEIPFMAPRLSDFIREAIDDDDRAVARNGLMRLRAAGGHGVLPPELAEQARRAVARLELLTQNGPLIQDLAVVLAVTSLAAINGWNEVAPRIDEVLASSFDATELGGEEGQTLLFETAFNRSLMEPDLHARTKLFAKLLLSIASVEGCRDSAITAAKQSAMAMPGSLAQPFVDTVAQLESV